MANLPDLFRRNRSLFSDFFHDLDSFFGSQSMTMPRLMEMTSPDMGRFDYEIDEDENQYIASFEVPGFKPEEIKVDISGNMLTVCAECEHEKEGKHAVSKRYGRIQRTLMLPSDVKAEHIKAHYENGLLEVCIPKTETSKRHTIEIESGRAKRTHQVQGKKAGAETSKSERQRH